MSGSEDLSSLEPPRSRFAMPPAVLILAAGLAVVCLIVMPQLKFAALHTSFYDLGQYATNINALAFGGGVELALSTHAQELLGLYAEAYSLHPSPASLLALQSAILVATAPLAGRLFAAWGAGRPLEGAVIYLLSISVWFSALFNFHFEHLLFPFYFAAMLASRREGAGAKLTALLFGLLICLVKEPYALMAAFFGLYLVIERRWYVTGLALALLASVYFLVITTIVIPYYSGGETSVGLWSSAFGYLGGSMGGVLKTIISDPLLPLSTVVNARKALYVMALGGAFAFVFLRAPLALLPALPVLALSLLSANPNHSYLGHQYTVGVTAPLFAATAIALGRIREPSRTWLKKAVLASSLGVLVLFGPSPVSRLFVQNATFSYGASAYLPTARDQWVKQRIEALIPEYPGAVVATQNSLLTTRLADRYDLVAFPTGVFTPYVTVRRQGGTVLGDVAKALTDRHGTAPLAKLAANWVVLDQTREPFVGDQGCGWRHGACTDKAAFNRFETLVARLPQSFERVFAEDGLAIYRRKVGLNGRHPAPPARRARGRAPRPRAHRR